MTVGAGGRWPSTGLAWVVILPTSSVLGVGCAAQTSPDAPVSSQASEPTSSAESEASDTEVCAGIDEQQVVGLFDRWNASLATGNPDAVVANYAADGVLQPTLSGTMRTTPQEMRDYFVGFLAKQPQGKVSQREIYLGCNTAVDTGNYTFTFGDGTSADARYSFAYAYRDGQWLVVSHHSSVKPAGE